MLFRAVVAVGGRGVWRRDDGYEFGVIVQGEMPHDSVEGNGPVRDDGVEHGERLEQSSEGASPLIDVRRSYAAGHFPGD
ncbi:hypothetical protein BIV03_10415 [Curtobacterium sp. MCBA15_016]|nr:hypothetical protein BIV03_10415 [Curtobacterium sp. MCBA15_016]